MSENRDVKSRQSSFWDHIATMIKYRWAIIIFMSLMAIASVSYALLATKWYRSDALILPPPSNAMGLGGLISGLSAGALGTAGMLSDETNLVFTILESRELRDLVIDEFNWMEQYEIEYRSQAYDRFNENFAWEFTPEGAIRLTLEEEGDELAAETVNFIVEETKRIFHEVSVAQARNQREFIGKRLEQNYSELEEAEQAMKTFQEETGVLAIEEQLAASVGALAEINTQLMLAEVQLEVYEATLPENSSEVLMAQREVSALRSKLKSMSSESEADAMNVIISMDEAPEVGMRYFRLFRELELQGTILEFLLPQYEQARIMEMRDKSNIYILDYGQVPERRFKPRRAFIVIAWMFISFVLFYTVILSLEWFDRLRELDRERHAYISGILQALRPANFFRRGTGEQRSSR